MKKIYLSAILLGATSLAFGQQMQRKDINQLGNAEKAIRTTPVVKPTPSGTQKALIWSEDFNIGATGPASTAGPTFTTSQGTWTTNGANGNIWKHSFQTTSGEWSNGTDPFNSTTKNNGFMLFDSDSMNLVISGGNQSLYTTFTGELISPTIDLTNESSALLSIQQDFRYCCTSSHDLNVQVSIDNGTTWSAPYDLTAGVDANDDFFTTNGSSYVQYANISSIAAGELIKLKFTWNGAAGNSHYYWTIDDIMIETLPDNDIQATAAYIVGVNNGGIEYGRTPIDQVDANWYVGTVVYNFGALQQTNVSTNDVYSGASSFSSTGSVATLDPDSTVIIEQTEALSLSVGTYSGIHTATSTGEQPGAPGFGNNTRTREFAIVGATTSPSIVEYSVDGIDVYTQNTVISSLGTNSFTGGEDGLVLASLYNIKQNCNPVGIRVMLSTQTQVGGEIYATIMDSSLFWAEDMTPLFAADISSAAITAQEKNQGYKDFYFSTPPTLTAGNAYYAAVELYSQSGASLIRVLDDETVEQPYDASAIYLPGGTQPGSYSNGTAFGIRLLFGSAGLEQNALSNVSIYPNPSNGVFNVSNEQGLEQTVEVYDVAGKAIYSTTSSTVATIDLSGVATGVYTVKVSNNSGSTTQNIVIK